MNTAAILEKAARTLNGPFTIPDLTTAALQVHRCKSRVRNVGTYTFHWLNWGWVQKISRGCYVRTDRFGLGIRKRVQPSKRKQYRNRYLRARTRRLNAMGLTKCGTPLQIVRRPNLRRLKGNAWYRAWKRIRGDEHAAAGLTRKGTVRRDANRKRWGSATRGKTKNERERVYHRANRKALIERGLTTRGTVRQRSFDHFPVSKVGIQSPPISVRELQWRELRASMDIELPEQEAA